MAKPLFKYEHMIVASPDYIRANGTIEHTSELASHACLTGPDQDSWTINRKRAAVSGWLKVNDNLSLIAHVKKGRGVARLPSYAVSQYIEQGEMEVIFKEANPMQHTMYIVHPQRLHQSARMRAFLKAVKYWRYPSGSFSS